MWHVILCNTVDAGRISHQMLPSNSACVLKRAPKIDFLPASLTMTITKKNI